MRDADTVAGGSVTDRRAPAWVKAVQHLDRAAYNAFRLYEVLREELLLTLVPPSQHGAVTARAYSFMHTYLPGGDRHEKGLFDWEERVLGSGLFPSGGRLLLGASGGGRELRVLLERGFEVVAFEPSPSLFEGSLEVARAAEASGKRATVVQATYQDLCSAVHGLGGPLAAALDAPFDAVVLGWGSLVHLTTHDEQRALFEALRRVCPGGPVLASFYLETEAPDEVGKAARVRRVVRGALRRVGAPFDPGKQLSYDLRCGFSYTFTEGELRALAGEAGYDVALLEALSFPHAVLVPRPLTPRG